MRVRSINFHTDEPLADGLIASLADEVMLLQFVSIEAGTFTFKGRRAPAESKVATEDRETVAVTEGGRGIIPAYAGHIAETVRQPRADLLVQDEPPSGPMPAYGKALGELMDDPSTKDVARLLIAPLLEHGLKLNGNPATVLGRVAREFKEQPASKLSFAAQYLLKGKHTVFPDFEEIYAAIGRYKPSPRASASDPNVHVNGVHP